MNSLDRVERVDKYRRKKKNTQINEVFSFIDKVKKNFINFTLKSAYICNFTFYSGYQVLSGCENGCSDEGCPLARGCSRTRHNRMPQEFDLSLLNGTGDRLNGPDIADSVISSSNNYAYNRPKSEVCKYEF